MQNSPIPTSPAVAGLIAITRGLDPFTSTDGQAFVRFPVPSSHGFYILPLRSAAFRHWCLYQFHGCHDSLPSPQAFHSFLNFLEAQANLHLDGALQRLVVGRRVTTRGADQLILDLADGDGRFVQISPGSWTVTAGAGPLFQTSRSTVSLPQPIPADPAAPSPLDTLRSLLNLPSRASWLRCLAWLLAAFRPSGPFPFLILQGPPASGKTLAARILRSLIDPSTAPLSPVPSTPHQLLTLVRHNWILAFDHISTLSPWLADALCRLSSGIGATFPETERRDTEPLHQYHRRPVILTVSQTWPCPATIEERALTLGLPRLSPEGRRPETALLATFQDARPAILGALCSALATALQRAPHLGASTGRCADALTWAVAASPALACTEAELREAFASPPESHPIVHAVRTLLEQRRHWTGTATDLLDLLQPALSCASPRLVSRSLRSAMLTLADSGIELKFRRLTGGARIIDLREDPSDANSSQPPSLSSLNSDPLPHSPQTQDLTS